MIEGCGVRRTDPGRSLGTSPLRRNENPKLMRTKVEDNSLVSRKRFGGKEGLVKELQ